MCPLYPLHIVLLYLCLILPLLLAVVQGSEELSGSILGASKGSLTFGAHYNGTYLNLDNLRTQEQNVSELEVSNPFRLQEINPKAKSIKSKIIDWFHRNVKFTFLFAIDPKLVGQFSYEHATYW